MINIAFFIDPTGFCTKFFEELEPKLYRQTLFALRDELERVHEVLKAQGFDKCRKSEDIGFAQHLFSDVVRTRESIVRFSEPHIVIAEEPKEKLKELFAYYVERNFVTREYVETRLEKGVRRWLYQVKLGERFQRMTIGDEDYQATFPFVERVDNRSVKVIKALHLAQDKPNKIRDHGGTLLFHLNELRKRNHLPEGGYPLYSRRLYMMYLAS